jgi:hypothetical protein
VIAPTALTTPPLPPSGHLADREIADLDAFDTLFSSASGAETRHPSPARHPAAFVVARYRSNNLCFAVVTPKNK